MVKLTCYDGVGCIGGNKILLEDGEAKIWLDFGLNFERMGKFYEEFLKPKSCLGLYEPVQMGLIPPIRGLYRDDLYCTLADPWSEIETSALDDISGILLSHAHMDHIGSISYVRDDIPIYCSAMTLAMAKASQDTGMGGFTSHYCYTAPYEQCGESVLTGVNYRKAPSRARPYVFVGEQAGAGLLEFWKSTPGSREHEAGDIPVVTECGGLKVLRFPLDHSVYGACAWAVETSAGWVVYTGDLRCHGRNARLTWEFAEQAAKLNPIALIIEGTRIDSDDTSTEDEIKGRAVDEVKRTEGLAVADFGPRNIERLVSFLDVAKETGRKLVVTIKDAYLLQAMRLADPGIPSLKDESILIYDKFEGSSASWKKTIRDENSTQLIGASDISRMQDKVICCFSFFDVNELTLIRPKKGSVWIYSSCEPFNEEMEIDLGRLRAWTDRYQMAFPSGSHEVEGNPFHVSGHASRTDLQKVIGIINPKRVIPVHTTEPQIYVEMLAGKCEVVPPERGVEMNLF